MMWDRCSRSGGSIDEICCIIGGADKVQIKPLHAGTKGCAFLVFLAAPYFVQTTP